MTLNKKLSVMNFSALLLVLSNSTFSQDSPVLTPTNIVDIACRRVKSNLSEQHDRFQPKEKDGRHPKLFSYSALTNIEEDCQTSGYDYANKFGSALNRASPLNRDKWYMGLMETMCNKGIPLETHDGSYLNEDSKKNQIGSLAFARSDCRYMIAKKTSDKLKTLFNDIRDNQCKDTDYKKDTYLKGPELDQCEQSHLGAEGRAALTRLYAPPQKVTGSGVGGGSGVIQ